jgi:hypothetical protein
MQKNRKARRIWQFPWGYSESFMITTGLMLVGFMLEFFSAGNIVQLPAYPLNLILLAAFIGYLTLTQIYVKGPVMTWLSSVPAAIASMTVFTFLILLMGFIPQGEPQGFGGKIGLHHIHTGKPYIITAVFMLTVLGYTIINRLRKKMSIRNFAFFLNHAGLFIIITAGSVGSSDMLRLSMPVKEGETSNIAFPDRQHQAKMPFSISLKSFTFEEYPPELMIYDANTGYPIIRKGSKFPFVVEGKKGKLLDYDFEVKKFIAYSVPEGEGYVYTEQFGSTHAALISIGKENIQTEGWISCGNFMFHPRYLSISEQHILGMAPPKTQRYVSVVSIERDGKTVTENAEIIVNKPLKEGQWKIYQSSYDGEMGRWSELSVFEVIRDPWLPVVYTGIFMMLLGSVYLLWVGRKL